MQLHKTQVSILRSLRYTESARFNELMRPTDHTSDTFKFHLQKLMKLGYIIKLPTGRYQLTQAGKEFANNLDERQGSARKQPKLHVLIIAPRQTSDDETEFLLQQRRRQPYFGFWSEITGPVRWGWSFQEAASRALTKHTGMQADFEVRGMRRIRDFSAETEVLLEDKLFVIVKAINLTGELRNDHAGSTSAWMTMGQLQLQEKHFTSTPRIIQDYLEGEFYAAEDLWYGSKEY